MKQVLLLHFRMIKAIGLLKIVLPNLPDDWNVIRMTILGEMLEKYLIPHYKEEVYFILIFLSNLLDSSGVASSLC